MKELNSMICKVTTAFLLPFLFSQSSRVNELGWLNLPSICLHNPFFYFSSCHSEHWGVPWGQILYPINLCISVSRNRFWYRIGAQWLLAKWGNKLGNIYTTKKLCVSLNDSKAIWDTISHLQVSSALFGRQSLFTHSSKEYKLVHFILTRIIRPQKQ